MSFLYTSKVVIDPLTLTAVANADLQAYAPEDTGHTTPLVVTDPTGVVLAFIRSNHLALSEPFVSDLPVVVLSDGVYSVPVDSPQGMLDAAEGAEASAQTSATSSATSAAAAATTAQEVAALRTWVERGVTTYNRALDPRLTAAAMTLQGATVVDTRPATGAPDGRSYFRRTMTTANTSSPMTMPLSGTGLNAIPVTPGEPFTNSWYARKSPAGGPTARVNLQWYDAAGVALSVTTGTGFTPGSAWSRFEQTVTVPDGAAFVEPRLQWSGIALVGQVLEFAQVQSEDGPAATEYHDGDTPTTAYIANRWASTANASVSERIDMRLVRSVNGQLPDATGNVEVAAAGGGVSSHGALSGLGNDDHPQYHNDTRGDARYYTKEQTGSLVANSVAADRPANRDRANHTGSQAISTVTDLESRLAALETAGSGSGITLIPEGTEPPPGSPVGLYGFIPGGEVPTTNIEVVSYTSTGSTVTCPVPTAAAVGDVLVFIPAFVGSDTNITVSDTGWVEKIDYAGQQTRKSGMYIYQVADAAALTALGSTVTASVANPGVRGGAVVRLTGALSATAWPAYSSGSNRSAATLNSATVTGFTVQAFATATVPFDRVMMWSIHDADNVPAASSGFTVLGHVSSSNAGAAPITLTLFIKAHSTAPVPAAVVTFPTAASAVGGGGQFIVPAV